MVWLSYLDEEGAGDLIDFVVLHPLQEIWIT